MGTLSWSTAEAELFGWLDGGFVAVCRIEQVRHDGEHGRAADQERRAVQDGKAQPGGAARQPQPARGTGAGEVHYGPPMR